MLNVSTRTHNDFNRTHCLLDEFILLSKASTKELAKNCKMWADESMASSITVYGLKHAYGWFKEEIKTAKKALTIHTHGFQGTEHYLRGQLKKAEQLAKTHFSERTSERYAWATEHASEVHGSSDFLDEEVS